MYGSKWSQHVHCQGTNWSGFYPSCLFNEIFLIHSCFVFVFSSECSEKTPLRLSCVHSNSLVGCTWPLPGFYQTTNTLLCYVLFSHSFVSWTQLCYCATQHRLFKSLCTFSWITTHCSSNFEYNKHRNCIRWNESPNLNKFWVTAGWWMKGKVHLKII